MIEKLKSLGFTVGMLTVTFFSMLIIAAISNFQMAVFAGISVLFVFIANIGKEISNQVYQAIKEHIDAKCDFSIKLAEHISGKKFDTSE